MRLLFELLMLISFLYLAFKHIKLSKMYSEYSRCKTLRLDLERLKRELNTLSSYNDVEFGYSNRYTSYNEPRFKEEKAKLRDRETNIIKSGKVLNKNTRSLSNDTFNVLEKLSVSLLNAEVELLLENISTSNGHLIDTRFEKEVAKINKRLQKLNVSISPEFCALKKEALYLEYEYLSLNKQNKDISKEQRRILREQQEVERLKELEELKLKEELQQAQNDEAKYENLLARAKSEAASAHGSELDDLQLRIKQLSDELTLAHAKSQRALSMAQQTTSGHVYVISNVGSFGENVFKIGVTRRLDPYDRVRELSNASVPFSFDVHAMIFSEDAPMLESKLHKTFNDHRINKVNLRKEFFNIELDKLANTLKDMGHDVDFIFDVECSDYRKSLLLSAGQS